MGLSLQHPWNLAQESAPMFSPTSLRSKAEPWGKEQRPCGFTYPYAYMCVMRQVLHFLDLIDFKRADLRLILKHAAQMKRARRGSPKGMQEPDRPLAGRIVALIFQRPSTRTRVSFEVAIKQLGGDALVISSETMQIGRGETIADTARVLSRYVDAMMIRAESHAQLTELAHYASVPVINGLTDQTHPTQTMADILTIEEHIGPLEQHIIAWVGDGNNVATSLIHAVGLLGGTLRLACPPSLAPKSAVLAWAQKEKANITLTNSPQEAATGAHCVITDSWVSMHQADGATRRNLLQPYQVNKTLMDLADARAIFMHCLPAHRGEEVTDEVMEGPQSVIFDEAENRLHVQKAILRYCLEV